MRYSDKALTHGFIGVTRRKGSQMKQVYSSLIGFNKRIIIQRGQSLHYFQKILMPLREFSIYDFFNFAQKHFCAFPRAILSPALRLYTKELNGRFMWI